MTTPTSYLQTLAHDEAIAFVTSLQKVKQHLSQELQWLNGQVQQKTIQLQGIQTLLSEAKELGLATAADSTTELAAAAAPAENSSNPDPIESPIDEFESPIDESESPIAADSNGDVSPLSPITSSSFSSGAALELDSTLMQPESEVGHKRSSNSKPKHGSKSSAASKTSAAKTKKSNNSVKSTGKGSSSAESGDLRQFLGTSFQGKTFTDSVAEMLDSATEPLHLNDLIAQMYEDLSDQNFKRAKTSLANVLSVGTGKGRWKNVGKGYYAANAR